MHNEEIILQLETDIIKIKSKENLINNICIPRVNTYIHIDKIRDKIQQLKLGKIDKIIEIPLREDKNYKRVIIKVIWDIRNKHAVSIRERLSEGKTIKLVHDIPWYWILVSSRS
jgi:hypothetical protein